MIEWTVNLAEDGLPLLAALQRRIPAAPRGFMRQLCNKQRITYAGEPAAATTPVAAGGRIGVMPSGRLQECIAASGLHPGGILHEDDHCLVLTKPAGLIVHPAPGHDDSLLGRLQAFLHLRGERFQVAAIHRIDIGTSGPVLFGKGRAAIRQLGQMFMAGAVLKGYLALIEGAPPTHGTLQSPVPAHGRYRPAIMHFRCLGRSGRQALLEIRLVTGRRHQIRRQLADAGWPLVGDSRYGSTAAAPMLLHSHLLAFRHPITGVGVRISPPLPAEITSLLDGFGLQPADLAAWGEISAHSWQDRYNNNHVQI